MTKFSNDAERLNSLVSWGGDLIRLTLVHPIPGFGVERSEVEIELRPHKKGLTHVTPDNCLVKIFATNVVGFETDRVSTQAFELSVIDIRGNHIEGARYEFRDGGHSGSVSFLCYSFEVEVVEF